MSRAGNTLQVPSAGKHTTGGLCGKTSKGSKELENTQRVHSAEKHVTGSLRGKTCKYKAQEIMQ